MSFYLHTAGKEPSQVVCCWLGSSAGVCVCVYCMCMCVGGGRGELSNVDFPFLRWSELEVLCFPRRMRILLCLSWADGNKIEAERETNNGKINRELNLTPQERGFEPKHSGAQCGHIYIMTEWAAGRTKGRSVCDSNCHTSRVFYFHVRCVCSTYVYMKI